MNRLILIALSLVVNITAQAQRRYLPPLMGWSSWNTYHVNINEELIKRQADALVDGGFADAGYKYINVDDGFFGYRDSTGTMHPHPERFPNGMRVVSDYIHSKGLKAGIYAEAGHNTCGSIYDDDINGVGAGLYGHEQQDMTLYLRDWNYDFIKIDYCGGRELDLCERERYQSIVDAIKQTGRGDVSINICRWAFPGTWARELARSWRISPDIRPRWSSVKNIIEKNLYLSAYAGEGHYNDMDMLEVGRGMKGSEDTLHFAMWCMMSSPLLIGCDMTTIKDDTRRLLTNRELISINQDPLGLQAYVVQRDSDCYVLVKDVETLRGTRRAVAFLNMSDNDYTFQTALSTLEMAGKTKVRDAIKGVNLKTVQGSVNVSVKPHCVRIWLMEAQERLEPGRYEAEWAYLPMYDDLAKRKKPISYMPSPQCSGGVKVYNIGGRKENIIRWSNVYSKYGGKYSMTIDYLCEKQRKLQVWVNGRRYDINNLSSGDDDQVAQTTLSISLLPGENEIVMGNNYGWAPDIDGFTLSYIEKL